METKEFEFQGKKVSGFVGLLMILVCVAIVVVTNMYFLNLSGIISPLMVLCIILIGCGLVQLEPNVARAMVFFGKYKGTLRENGFWWIVNPFYTKKKISLRARNLNAEAIKVNDKSGNPIMIGLVMVWRIKDVYKAMFEIDSQTMGQTTGGVTTLNSTMRAFENFVSVQSDAALRQVAGRYNYDENSAPDGQVTLRSGADEINEALKQTLNDRLAIAGIEAVEARINYLAYAPEIAAVMLRRQQADAYIHILCNRKIRTESYFLIYSSNTQILGILWRTNYNRTINACNIYFTGIFFINTGNNLYQCRFTSSVLTHERVNLSFT